MWVVSDAQFEEYPGMTFKALGGQLLCASFQTTSSPLPSYPCLTLIYPFFTFLVQLEMRSNVWGSWAQKPLQALCFLFAGNSFQPPWPSLNSKGQVWTVADQRRGMWGDAETREEQPRNKSAALGQGSGSFSRHTYSSVSSSSLKNEIPPTDGRWQHSSFQIGPPGSRLSFSSHVQLFATKWTTACQASLSFTISWSSLKLMSIELVMSSNHFILCCPLLLPPLIFPSIKAFSSESALRTRWSKYWSFSFSINPSNEYSGLISSRIDWFDLLAPQGTLKSLLDSSSKPTSVFMALTQDQEEMQNIEIIT